MSNDDLPRDFLPGADETEVVSVDDRIARRAAEWLTVHCEIERLTGHWSALETSIRKGMEGGSKNAQEALVQIDRQLAVLYDEKSRCGEALAAIPARTPADVIQKLIIAERLLGDEGDLAHDLVAQAAAALSAHFARRDAERA